jgi:hypothetical protein
MTTLFEFIRPIDFDPLRDRQLRDLTSGNIDRAKTDRPRSIRSIR